MNTRKIMLPLVTLFGLLFSDGPVSPEAVRAQQKESWLKDAVRKQKEGAASSSQKPANDSAQSGESQSASSAVEVKSDRISKARVITLKPQTVLDTPQHLFQIELETKISPEDPGDMNALPASVIVRFHSFTNTAIERGDEELHFLVDGKPLNAGRASRNVSPSPMRERWSRYSTYFASMSLKDLRQVSSSGRAVEMRLGSIETNLSPELLKNLRGFVAAAASNSP